MSPKPRRAAALLVGLMLIAASPVFAAGNKPPTKDAPPSPTMTQSQCDQRCKETAVENFENKSCGDVKAVINNGLCECRCMDQPGGRSGRPRK
jgi:hypothetical protein